MAGFYYKRILIGLAFCWLFAFMPAHASAQSGPDEAFVVWRGFEHNWTYNHRLNRLGDYVSQGEFKTYPFIAKDVHTGATGVGKDSASFTSYYSVIKTNNVGVFPGFTDISLSGQEDMLKTSQTSVSFVPENNLKNCDRYVVLINGFDLISDTKADKLKLLKIDASDATYDKITNKVSFRMKAAFVVNCSSFECNQFNQQFDYTLRVHYLVIGGNNNYFNSQEQSFSQTYDWDKKEEINPSPLSQVIYGRPGFNFTAMGFKSLTVNLDRDHWIVDWKTSITPGAFDSKTGKKDYTLNLYIKQWTEEMKTNSPFAAQAKFSSKKPGWANLEGSVVLLQFKDACIEHYKRSGKMGWMGKNQTAFSESSESKHIITVDKNCKYYYPKTNSLP